MELVTLAAIELHRPQSARQGFFGAPANQKMGIFVVDDSEVETLKIAVLDFAEQCGVDRNLLHGLRRVSGYLYSNNNDAIIFDINTPNVQYGTPYATCNVGPALKVGARYFRLSEITNVSVL